MDLQAIHEQKDNNDYYEECYSKVPYTFNVKVVPIKHVIKEQMEFEFMKLKLVGLNEKYING